MVGELTRWAVPLILLVPYFYLAKERRVRKATAKDVLGSRCSVTCGGRRGAVTGREGNRVVPLWRTLIRTGGLLLGEGKSDAQLPQGWLWAPIWGSHLLGLWIR